jgi:hypothetical protein
MHDVVTRVVLDVDTGTDDALALLYSVSHPKLDLGAVTCASGNVALQQIVLKPAPFSIWRTRQRSACRVGRGRHVPWRRPTARVTGTVPIDWKIFPYLHRAANRNLTPLLSFSVTDCVRRTAGETIGAGALDQPRLGSEEIAAAVDIPELGSLRVTSAEGYRSLSETLILGKSVRCIWLPTPAVASQAAERRGPPCGGSATRAASGSHVVAFAFVSAAAIPCRPVGEGSERDLPTAAAFDFESLDIIAVIQVDDVGGLCRSEPSSLW